jgi:hypothetical protein
MKKKTIHQRAALAAKRRFGEMKGVQSTDALLRRAMFIYVWKQGYLAGRRAKVTTCP